MIDKIIDVIPTEIEKIEVGFPYLNSPKKGRKPVIGVTGPSTFSAKIQKMVETFYGAIPLFINQNDPEDLNYVLEQCNGIILVGGVDVCPITFKFEITNHSDLSHFDIERDEREIYIVNWAKRNGVPLFGICRGHQLIGLINELPFFQNINGSDVSHNPTSRKIDIGDLPSHYVLVKNSKYWEIFHKMEMVNSFHHQAVQFKKGFNYDEKGIDVIGYAKLNYDTEDNDNKIIELMKSKHDDSWLSCQWHPENDYEKRLPSWNVLNYFKKMMGL